MARITKRLCLCFFRFVVFRPTREFFIHIESSQLPLQELKILEICCALMAILQ